MVIARNIGLMLAAALALSSCEQITESQTTLILDSPPKVTTIDQYFSPNSFGPLLRLYDFRDQRLILKIRISNDSADMPLTATLNTFGADATDKAIDKWVNNQHSDALYADAAEPDTIEDLSETIVITNRTDNGSITGRRGEPYQQYTVSYTVAEIRAGDLTIAAFEDTARVHVLLSQK